MSEYSPTALSVSHCISVLHGEALLGAIAPPTSTVVVRVMCAHEAVLCAGCGPFTWSLVVLYGGSKLLLGV